MLQNNFNTSHVTVYRGLIRNTNPITSFQYISCYCLSGCCQRTCWKNWISIHLMLLFIGSSGWFITVSRSISIHLMLLFIVLLVDSLPCPDHISIHLMLLFIVFLLFRCHLSRWISIHLMLLFIHFFFASTYATLSFQYISCYCLSLSASDLRTKLYKFQYISCYCLSVGLYTYCIGLKLFQYISCYCLSWPPLAEALAPSIISIHLMLLFIKSSCVAILGYL